MDPTLNFTLFLYDTTISVSEVSALGSVEAQKKADKWFISNKLVLNTSKTERVDVGESNLGVCFQVPWGHDRLENAVGSAY